MAPPALRHWVREDLDLRFVSNVDGDDLAWALRNVDPETTLFIVASKTFTTLETLTNARHAKAWLHERLGPDTKVERHFVALSTNAEAVAAFGIDPANMFGFWDWVGGRYSLDSAIGLSLMIGIGPAAFGELLDGFRRIDEHVREAPLDRERLGPHGAARPLVPQLPRRLHPGGPALQRGARPVPGLPPAAGDGVQRQAGHPRRQGGRPRTRVPSCGASRAPTASTPSTSCCTRARRWCRATSSGSPNPPTTRSVSEHHDLLTANLLAQAEALAFGRTAEEVAASGVVPELVPHRTFPGNVPSTTILAPRLTPSVLGQLVALYEHKVAALGFLWGINSFDQWGVELGKQLATTIASEIADGADGDHDSSTIALLRRYRQLRGEL